MNMINSPDQASAGADNSPVKPGSRDRGPCGDFKFDRRMVSVIILAVIAASIILPNYLIYSTDELFIGTQARPFAAQADIQGINGRYAYVALLRLLDLAGVGWGGHVVLSGALLCLCGVALLIEIFKLARIDSPWARVAGASLYFTYSLNMDLFQFKEAYLSYALSFGFAALALRFSRQIWSVWMRLGACSACLFLSFGFYQISLQLVVLALGVWAVSIVSSGPDEAPGREPWILAPSIGVAGAAYLLCDQALKYFAVDVFASYPIRPQGVSFIIANIGTYLMTLLGAYSPFSHMYYPLTNAMLSSGYLVLIVLTAALLLSRAQRPSQKGLVVALFLFCLLCAPNPANLVLATYWPSPRTVGGIAIFYAGVVGLAMDRKVGGVKSERWLNPSLAALAILIAFASFANNAYLLGRRYAQQVSDFALAQQIVTDIERLSPDLNRPIVAKVVVNWYSNLIFENTPYSFGIGLFGTSWSGPATLAFVSGGAIIGQSDDPATCSSATNSFAPSIIPLSEGVVRVCFPNRRVGSGIAD